VSARPEEFSTAVLAELVREVHPAMTIESSSILRIRGFGDGNAPTSVRLHLEPGHCTSSPATYLAAYPQRAQRASSLKATRVWPPCSGRPGPWTRSTGSCRGAVWT
jgi:hypothetical protein